MGDFVITSDFKINDIIGKRYYVKKSSSDSGGGFAIDMATGETYTLSSNSSEGGSGSIISTVNDIIGLLYSFEQSYKELKHTGTITTKRKKILKNLPIVDCNIYHKGFPHIELSETITSFSENSFLQTILSFFEVSDNLLSSDGVRVFTQTTRIVNAKLPMLIPTEEHTITVEPSLVLPNYSQMFFNKSDENICKFQFYNVSSIEHVFADLVTTLILTYFSDDMSTAIAIMFVLQAFNMSKSVLMSAINKSKYSDIDELKDNNSFFDDLYDRLENLRSSGMIINRIFSNLSNTVFNMNMSDILEIIANKTDNEIRQKITNFKVRFSNAKAFCEKFSIPSIEFIIRQEHRRKFFIQGVQTKVIETKRVIQQSPSNISIQSSENILETENVLKGYSLKPITRKIKVINTKPISINVDITQQITDFKVTYSSDNDMSGFVNIFSITLPVTNWRDAVNVSSYLYGFFGSSKTVTKNLQIVLDNTGNQISDIIRLINDLNHNTVSFSIAYNNAKNMINVSYQTIEDK